MNFWLKYILYILRWELSTPILAGAILLLPGLSAVWQAAAGAGGLEAKIIEKGLEILKK